MSDAPNEVSYSNLDTTKNEIRLLHLQPGYTYQEIRCKLIRSRLYEPRVPQYEALSYEWGPESSDHSIWVDDQKMSVRANLYEALKLLRLQHSVRILWIDAVCINQEHIGERNHQVKVMGEIYKRASRVIVWLGPRTWSDENNVIYVGDIHTTLLTLWDNKLPTASKYKPSLDFEAADAKNRRHLLHSPFDPTHWVHVEHFFRITYWGRLWILQEVLSASEVVIQYGHETMEWKYLENMIRQFEDAGFRKLLRQIDREERSLGHNTLNLLRHIEKMDSLLMTVPGRLCQQRFNRRKFGPRPQALLTLVLRYRDSQCFDLRDKIFGLYSLSYGCCQEAIPVDYMRTTVEICSALLRHHLACHPDDDGGETLQVISLARELFTILEVKLADAGNMTHTVCLGADISASASPVTVPCYLRGTILYTCCPADITRTLRAKKHASELEMPPEVTKAHRRHMRSFLKDAENDFLPTLCKPGKLKGRADRLEVSCSEIYHTLVAKFKTQRIWEEWLWGLELPDHEDLWEKLPFVFFTADGQIGLSAEEFEVGDEVLEFDRVNADCVVLRRVSKKHVLVGTAHAVLGSWGPTPRNSLEKVSLGFEMETIGRLSDRVNGRPVENLVFRSRSLVACPARQKHVWHDAGKAVPWSSREGEKVIGEVMKANVVAHYQFRYNGVTGQAWREIETGKSI